MCLLSTGLAQNFNRPVPSHVSQYEFVKHTPVSGYYLSVPIPLNSITPVEKTIPIILDANGYLTWFGDTSFFSQVLDFKYFEASQEFAFGHPFGGPVCEFTTMTTDLLVDKIFFNQGTFGADPHDFIRLENGNYLFSAKSDSVMDLSAYTFNGIQGGVATHAYGFVIQEVDSDNNVLFEWDSNDHIHPSEWIDTYPYNVNGFDYCHGNAVEEDEDGNFLISFRHLDAIYRIDRNTGEVIWKLGGQSSDFTFTNDAGFSGQHDVRLHANGVISLFDNANSSSLPHHSRAVEYQLDTVNWTATRTWEYNYNPAFFSSAMGNNQRTIDGGHLINYGLNYRPNPSFIHLDASDNLQTELFYHDSMVAYRSYYYEFPFDLFRPVVTCETVGGQVQLNAELGHTSYLWSSGETASSILVSNPGTYQVWVNHGVGMAGSFPVEVTSEGACYTGIPELIASEEEKWQWFDMLGRPVEKREAGRLYIGVSDQGATQKVVWLE